ncbi:MAG: hypothetical protein ACI9SK_000986 [Zhongshania sp.]
MEIIGINFLIKKRRSGVIFSMYNAENRFARDYSYEVKQWFNAAKGKRFLQ